MSKKGKSRPFSLKRKGRYEYDADFTVEDDSDYSTEDEVTIEFACSSIDETDTEDDYLVHLGKVPQDARVKRNIPSVSREQILFGIFLVMGTGFISMIMFGFKEKEQHDNNLFIGDALKTLEEDLHKMACTGTTQNMTREQWLAQETTNIAALCDPEFLHHTKKLEASRTPVKVFVLMGEASMVGAGLVHGKEEGSLEYTVLEKKRFVHLIDQEQPNGEHSWNARKDVRYVGVRDNFDVYEDRWLGIEAQNDYFGLEQQFGYVMGETLDEPVLIINSASGHSSLGGDLLPPGSTQYEKEGFIYPGYGESPERWRSGENPGINTAWHAGMKYKESVENVHKVLHSINAYYPGASTYEIAGFVWWQGDSDRRSSAYTEKYEENLEQMIRALRYDFLAPQAKFVLATVGQGGYSMNGHAEAVFRAQMDIGSYEKYPKHKGNVAAVDTRAAWRDPVSAAVNYDSIHYGNNAETFLEVGNAVGLAMAKLLLE